MTIEYAFDFDHVKQDGTLEYTVFGESKVLPKNRILHVYNSKTGKGPFLFWVSAVTQATGTNYFTHRLTPLQKLSD